MRAAKPVKHQVSAWKRISLYSIVILLILLVLVSQYGDATRSIVALKHAHPGYVVSAGAVIALSYAVAAASYTALAWPRLRYGPTLMVQIATGLTNRLLPAGLGGMGLYAAYIRKQSKSTYATATGTVASNNVLGLSGNILLVSTVLLSRPDHAAALRLPQLPDVAYAGLIVGFGIIISGTLVYARARSGRVKLFVSDILATIRKTLKPSWRTLVGLAGNMANTGLNVLALSLVVTAVGGVLSWTDALLVLSLGAFVGAVVPTPGGIGGVEAGLFAGLLIFGVTGPLALAAVLLQRALTYWLPILPGAAIFHTVEKRYL